MYVKAWLTAHFRSKILEINLIKISTIHKIRLKEPNET